MSWTWLHNPRVRGNLILAAGAVVVFGGAAALGAWSRACLGDACPSPASLTRTYDPEQASKVYAADGRLITDLGLERRTVVPLSEMAPAVKAAFVVTEDKRFYSHHGIDYIRVLGAVRSNIIHMRVAEGFSTITMQLARNLWPEAISGRDRSLNRKIREAKVALEIERMFSKDRILELYLNQIGLGNGAYGVEVASQRYFGKSVRNLNVAEAATLAALPKGPSLYNPRRNPQRAIARRNLVINLLRDQGYLTPVDAERWKAWPLELSSRSDYSDVAPYFVEYVRQLMDAQFGPGLYRDGLRIYTTLDLDMQQTAERSLTQQLEDIEGGKAYGNFPHPTYAGVMQKQEEAGAAGSGNMTQYLQGASVTVEAQTGYIRAMVGGRDFNDSKYNRAIQAMRQPGSTFKPFVYSAALRAGYPFSTVMVDEPITLTYEDTTEAPWEPQNYDLTFRGPMTLREALYRSVNIVAIKLGMELGPQAVISEARRFGITTPIPPYPSIYIGAAEVTPLEMVGAYTAFANLGVRTTPIGILRVEDRNGNILWQARPRSERIMDPQHAWLMESALEDVVNRGTAFVNTRGRGFTVPAGGKTGTTNDYADVWFIGFTPDYVTGIWIGMDQRQRIMDNAQGGRLAAPAWTAMMKEIYERRPAPEDWARPDGLTFDTIDNKTGFRYTPFCPPENRYVESFIPGTEPTQYCPIHNPFTPGGGAGVGQEPH
ncbi:MAG: penicillin-binding protein 1A [Gemmatimonadales bacterium]